MKEAFVNLKKIGSLYLKTVLVEYDHPLIFVCEDDYNSLYLFTECEISESRVQWLSKKITQSVFNDLIFNNISLRNAFLIGEKNYLYVEYNIQTGQDTYSEHSELLNDGDIPRKDIYVGSSSGDKEWDFKDIIEYSNQSGGSNTIIEYVINHGDNSKKGLKYNKLIDLLSSVASLVPGVKPRAQAFVGNSFVIRLDYEHREMLPLDANEFTDNLQKAVKSQDEEALRHISSKSKGALNKLDKVLQILEESNSKLDVVEYTSLNQRRKHYSLSSSEVKSVRNEIKKSISDGWDEHKRDGYFYMVDTKNLKFGFVSDDNYSENQMTCKGDIDKSINPADITFTKRYSVIIHETFAYQSGSNQERFKSIYTLKGIKKISDK